MSSCRSRRSPSRFAALVFAAAALIAGPAGAHVDLDAPLGGQVLHSGSTYLILWHVAIAHATVNWDLEYSLTGANGPWLPIATDLPPGDISTGAPHSYLWVVPPTPSAQVRVRVRQDQATGLDYYGASTSDLSIALSFSSATAVLSAAAGGNQVMSLQAGSAAAGLPYLVLGSLSGTTPGQPFAPFVLPLNADFYFDYTLLNPGAFPLSGSFGLLDAAGTATASLILPPLPALAGLVLDHAFVVADATPALVLVSNAVTLTLGP